MILPHINQKMPIYKDCTLIEVMLTSGAVFVLNAVMWSLCTRVLFGYGAIGLGLTFLLTVPLTRWLCGRLQRLKVGKPRGYYPQLFLKTLSQHPMSAWCCTTPGVLRCGRWSVRRWS